MTMISEPVRSPLNPRLSRRGAMLGVAFLIAGATVAMAATQPDRSAKAFLEGIYKNYLGSSIDQGKGVTLDQPAVIRRYFTAGLASLMLEDERKAAKRADVPDLDGDPFVGHQDWNIADLAVAIAANGPTKATGTVTFVNEGRPEKIVVDLLKSDEGWRIADIQWADGTLRGLYRKK